jgi:hypothetical protein
MKNSNLLESFDEFIKLKESNEVLPSYDEQDESPRASIRQEDWQSKDTLQQSVYLLSELIAYIEDGEELEPGQEDIIKTIFDSVNKLKRQFEDREAIIQKEIEDSEK